MNKAVKWKPLVLISLLTVALGIFGYNLQQDAPAISQPLYWGSSGQPVRELQWRLQQWGYYQGATDGDFGQRTFDAVKKFQANNGLTADGVAGKATLVALGLWTGTSGQPAPPPPTSTSRGIDQRGDVALLARAIHAEAGAEPYEGQVAVGAVILNRTSSPLFPNSLSGVIYQPLAFESVSNGMINQPADADALRAAQAAMNGWDPTYGCLFFWNPAKKVSVWIWSRKIVTQIGAHVFAL
ncbi:MAG TPA: spore cortex-lytic enzyme [Bacillota bacterium]|nr:spore cortex-lytic enzyme [Bacillota bacterium]